MTVLFWDIDGTLLTTAKGGMFAWDDAVKEITGREFALQSMRIPGMTDYQIAARTFEMLGLERTEELTHQLVRRYEELLPTSLPRRTGHVLTNVREVLEQLRGQLAAWNEDPPGFDWSWRTVGEYLDRLDADGIAINAAYLAPHGTIRMIAMGTDDPPTDASALELADAYGSGTRRVFTAHPELASDIIAGLMAAGVDVTTSS